MSRFSSVCILLILVLALLVPGSVSATPLQQTATPPARDVSQIIARLTPEERIGQLFLVTFKGAAAAETTPIFELIDRYHVGGVALLADNDNFTELDTAANTLQLTTRLQALAAGIAPPSGASGASGAVTPPSPERQFIPLLIATPYAETNFPGGSFLPSPMTLGGTWNPAYAQTTGHIVGQELSALGINLLLGPALDVIESPQPGSPADVGARAFGGNPYWVGKLGQAFIQGVHEGSQERVAVVAQHFPGYGAADRALESQIPTVNKSREELKAVDLAPFFAVTRTGAGGDADALLVSHIRYSGLQGPVNDATTRPISLDKPALGSVLNMPELVGWRARGGLTVSDALGVRAIRRFYDPAERNFPAFIVARDAFLAGNDVLYLSQFAENGAGSAETIRAVLDSFVEKYKTDASFALRVNEAVIRILKLKLKLYGEFTLQAVSPTTGLEVLGAGSENALTATQDAAALISPTGLVNRPNRNQRIVFFTDTRPARVCSACALQPALAADALQKEVLRLYGPRGTNEAIGANLASFSFVDLINFLNNKGPAPTDTPLPESEAVITPVVSPTPSATNVEVAIREADWVVLAMLDVRLEVAESQAVRRLLAERPDLLNRKQVVVFALAAPYYLDATDVAHLTAYYALYNHTPAAVEVAARILFQEITPGSVPPVSIGATGYNLAETLQPDPDQAIELLVETTPKEGATPTPPDQTPAPPVFGLNDVVTLHTSVIVDRFGHPVPDGTPVKFSVFFVNERIQTPLTEVGTVDGVATISYRLERVGILELTAASGSAVRSGKAIFPVTGVGSPATIVPPPTLTPTDTATPTETPTSSPTPEITPTPTQPVDGGQPTPSDLLLTLVTLGVMGVAAWRLTKSRGEAISDGIKLFLVITIGALAGYNYYALNLPGAGLVGELKSWAVPFMVWSGGLIGFGLGWWWLKRSKD